MRPEGDGVEHLDAAVLLTFVPAAIHAFIPVERAPRGAQPSQGRMQRGLIVLDADQQGIAGRGSLGKPIFLAMQRVGGEQHAGDAKLGHQLRRRRDLVRCPGQLLVRQNQGGVAGESAEHVNRLAVGQVVKAAASRLVIERDRAQRLWCVLDAQVIGVTAKGGFEIVTAECQEQVPQGVLPPERAGSRR